MEKIDLKDDSFKKMDRYEQVAIVGEGSYGLVMKCRHKHTGTIVAIKKFLETEEDANARKMAFREIRMLKRLRHENLITMIEVFRFRKRFYLVFEFVEGTILDELDKKSGGLGEEMSRKIIFQVTRAIHFCHLNNVIHRDVKPENILVSSRGVVKLCDFGFARLVSLAGEQCTEYVATRWYRAPELLVGDLNYGAPVDIWAIGCMLAEIMTGNPILPGESDIDQLYLTIRLLGKPCNKHLQLMTKNSQLRGMIKSADRLGGLYKVFSSWPPLCIDMLNACMKMDPQQRITADELLRHAYFTHDNFAQKFMPILRDKVMSEINENPLLRKIKQDILLSTDKAQETKIKRPPVEIPRWKLNFQEGSVKRKLSCDSFGSGDNPFFKNQQLLSPHNHLSNRHHKDKGPTPRTVQISFNPPSNQSEMQMLQKTLESLSKLGQKSENEQRPRSLEKTERTPSPLDFQSLQYTHTIKNFNSNILHPIKKSPNITDSIHVSTLRNHHQTPLINPTKSQYFKRAERNTTQDMSLASVKNMVSPPWLNINSEKLQKRKEKPKNNDFSLPNLPGATIINPIKVKQKSPEILQTPRILSSSSQKSASSRHLDNLISFK